MNALSTKIKIQYFGSIRAAANLREEEVEIPTEITVAELLRRVSGSYGRSFRDEIFEGDDQKLREDLMVSVNGTLAAHTNIMETKLHPGDIIALLPIFLGGG